MKLTVLAVAAALTTVTFAALAHLKAATFNYTARFDVVAII